MLYYYKYMCTSRRGIIDVSAFRIAPPVQVAVNQGFNKYIRPCATACGLATLSAGMPVFY